MALGVMVLDVLELGGPTKRRLIPVEISHPLVQIGISAANISDVALEVLDVDGVEADDGRIEADVGLGDLVAEVERSRRFSEVGFGAVERFEELLDILLVRFLGCREAGFVHAVVDVVISPGVGFFDLGLEVFGEEDDVFVFVLDQVVEFRVEHADDF